MKRTVAFSLLSLFGAAVMFAAGTLFSSASRNTLAATPAPTPATARAAGVDKQTFVLVHGAGAGGWEWKKCGDFLLSHGHTVYRPTLTGQGERAHLSTPDIDINTHIQDVVNVVLFEQLRDIVLVGHSYGGAVITGVIDRIPDRIKCAIYVDAGLPLDGEPAAAGRTGSPIQVVDGYIRTGVDPKNPGRQPPYNVYMPAKTFLTPMSLKNQAAAWKVPTMYILTVDPGQQPENDMLYNSYKRALDRGWATSIMPGDHVVHINQTANLVERLEKATLEAKPASKNP
jgi:pimeloyl-ACP methyl ester carboxylesterase